MTLRVTLEIVPFGEEENKRTLGTINISNIGPSNEYDYLHAYHVHELPVAKPVLHDREEGAWMLVQRVLIKHMDRLTDDMYPTRKAARARAMAAQLERFAQNQKIQSGVREPGE